MIPLEIKSLCITLMLCEIKKVAAVVPASRIYVPLEAPRLRGQLPLAICL